MTIIDIGIAVGGILLALTSLPTLINKQSQVPRWSASVPTAVLLTYLIPLFFVSGLQLTTFSIVLEAICWWAIAIFRPIKLEVVIK